MRQVILLALIGLLVSCGGGRKETKPTRVEAYSGPNPQFQDNDPYPWTSTRPWQYPIHGIDVSRYQQDIDWPLVRQSRVSFAFIKATEGGDHLDNMFATNWRAAKRAGVRRGAYHFYYFCRTASEQANWFISNVPRDPSALPPVLDVEWNHQSRTCRARPEPRQVRAQMKIFLSKVARHYGKRPVIYATPDFYEENQLWRVKGYDFWLRSVAAHPRQKYPGKRWSFWQYTGTGVVPGIQGNTDLNAFAGSAENWSAWLASQGIQP